MSLRSKSREQLARDVEAFLQSGGRIKVLPAGVSGEQISLTYYDTRTGKMRKVTNRHSHA